MSAPNTNVEKQARRHRPSLVGIGWSVAFALVLLVALLVWVAYSGNTPEGADTQLEVGTGTVETDG